MSTAGQGMDRASPLRLVLALGAVYLIWGSTYLAIRYSIEDLPPFLMAGAWIRSVVTAPFSEAASNDSDLHIDPGADLMEYFLFSGRNNPRSAARPS